jgi:hypothetical protein
MSSSDLFPAGDWNPISLSSPSLYKRACPMTISKHGGNQEGFFNRFAVRVVLGLMIVEKFLIRSF